MGMLQVLTGQTPIPALGQIPVVGQTNWYALQTRSKHEKKVAAELEEKCVPSYLPLLIQVHRWSDRRKTVQVPLFPGYVFVNTQLDPYVRVSILRIWGVLSFVGSSRGAVAIPESQIEDIRILLSTKLPFTAYPFLKIGQRVRVRGGALEGLEGILVNNGHKRLVISVEGIQRSLSVTIDGYDIEAV